MLKNLRQIGTPLADVVAPKPFSAHQAMLDPVQPPGRNYYWKSENLPDLTNGAIDTIVAHSHAITSPHTIVAMFQLVGAVATVDEAATAYSHRRAAYALNCNASWEDGDPAPHVQWAQDFSAAPQPHSMGVYVNFLGEEGEDRAKAAYGPEKYARLVALKDKYDPTNFFPSQPEHQAEHITGSSWLASPACDRPRSRSSCVQPMPAVIAGTPDDDTLSSAPTSAAPSDAHVRQTHNPSATSRNIIDRLLEGRPRVGFRIERLHGGGEQLAPTRSASVTADDNSPTVQQEGGGVAVPGLGQLSYRGPRAAARIVHLSGDELPPSSGYQCTAIAQQRRRVESPGLPAYCSRDSRPPCSGRRARPSQGAARPSRSLH